MKILEKSPDLLTMLQSFPIFQNISELALSWMIEKSRYVFYGLDEYVFQPGRPADYMMTIIQGKCSVEFMQQGELRIGGAWEAGEVTGILPFSRMKESRAYGRVLEPCYILELHRECFVEMVNVSYELTQALVGVMSDRVRDFTQMRSQNEKLISLGKLSAGLAHELNNPASAMVRIADELYKRQHQTPERFKAVITMRVTPEQTDAVNAILFSKMADLNNIELSLLERESRKDDMIDWLEDQGVEEAEEIAETLVDFGFEQDDLEQISDIAHGQHLATILWWIEGALSSEKLLCEIKESANRIATLVKAIKSYSHMDRGSAAEPTDLYEGVKSTLIMLKHKLKEKRIQIEKNFQENLPKVIANPGELNQVWTNLFDNAIDAMDEEGMLKIKAYANHRFVTIEITDNGAGLPEENITRIFDPFYTTKSIGEGTGMGLDIVKKIIDRQKGTIGVISKPGETTFTICLPIPGN
ncbi:MAG: GHKL domain-containing protein [Saprospiraceae bacterium]|nr:GHKL domain-containing protein [Saprospiraceae bacterium]